MADGRMLSKRSPLSVLRAPEFRKPPPDDPSRKQRIEGLFVEISDMTMDIFPEEHQTDADPDCKPINANGKRGRVVFFLHLQQKYVIHTFDGYWVCIPEDNLTIWPPPRPVDGGFDVCWPSKPQGFPTFTVQLASALAKQGYVVVQTIASDRRRVEAMETARLMTDWTMPREEVVQDFLGRGGRAKLGVLKPGPGTAPAELGTRVGHTACTRSSCVAASNADPTGAETKMDSLDRCCLEMTNIFGFLRPAVRDSLGIELSSLTEELVWLPFENDQEEQKLCRGRINNSDVRCGKLHEHLVFLQRRKLCFLYLVCGAADINLYPKEKLSMRKTTIPMVAGKIMIFRHDHMSFGFTPKGREPFLVIQAWTLEAPQQLEIKQLIGDPVSRDRIRGLKSGPVEPPGNQVKVNSILSKMPGNSRCAMRLWTMLLEGCDAQVKVPIHRFDVDMYCVEHGDYPQGRPMSFHGGFCSDRDLFSFNNTIFDVSVEEATCTAPAQRTVLTCGLQCLEMAGFQKDNLEGQLCGVFVGGTSSYINCPLSEYEQQRLSSCTIAGRLAHALGIKGPVMTLDTACSSSLVATDVALTALRGSLRCQPQDPNSVETLQRALVIGISAIVGAQWYATLNSLRMLSTRGRCLSFDASSDGYARGEGCGAIYLSTGTYSLYRLAVIVGSATDQGGRSATLTAPNGPSQARCILDSLEVAAVQPGEVSVMECHSTGTPLGDTIEVCVLGKAVSPRSIPLPCTSAKSHIGHLEAGAGLAGLIKSVLMLLHSSPTPSCHIRSINSSLDREGFPVLLETELVDTHLNSGISGVSSFGFSGTNAHADIWAECREGPRATGELDIPSLDQIRVTCPVVMGPIDHVTAEPAMPKVRKKYHSDVLREELAKYDRCSHYWPGKYRFRSRPLFGTVEDGLPPGTKVYIRGTWSGWKVMEEMNLQMDGWYNTVIVLGECRYELFSLCLDADKRRELYPAVHNASESIWTCGPDGGRRGRGWLIDGRDRGVPTGTPYRIRFQWQKDRKVLIWHRAPADLARQLPTYHHMYSIVGSFTGWEPQDLERSTEQEGAWECRLRVSSRGYELFQFVRDGDFSQAIYPARPNMTRMSIPVRGPDELGHGKNWQIRGPSGDGVLIRLRIVDSLVSVTVISDTKGTKAWRSERGWERRDYFLAGNFNGWSCAPMTMDPMRPGTFKAIARVGVKLDTVNTGYLLEFQILIDKDYDRVYYPEVNGAGSGEGIVCGPDHHGKGKYFRVTTSTKYSRAFEVALDLTSVDRRLMVTWHRI